MEINTQLFLRKLHSLKNIFTIIRQWQFLEVLKIIFHLANFNFLQLYGVFKKAK